MIGNAFFWTGRVVRRLAREPGYALGTSFILALGLAAAAGFLILVHGILFAPLPFDEPEELYGLSAVNAKEHLSADALSVADFADLNREQTHFTAMAAYRGDFLTYSPTSGSTRQWIGSRVTPDFFKVLAIQPVHGRFFAREDFEQGEALVAILSEDLWEREFNRDPALIGSSVRVNGSTVEVIGILPRTAREPSFAEVWLPFPDGSGEYFMRDARYWTAICRLSPDSTPEAAEAELKTIAEQLAEAYPKSNRDWTIVLQPLLEMRVAGVRQTLLLGTLTAALLLGVTALSLTNLLLARGLRRQSDYAVQRALGASNRHLAGEAALEAILLTLAGGIGALLLLWLVFDGILPRLPDDLLPRLRELRLDLSAYLFLAVVTLGTALLSALWPAWQATRSNLLPLLQGAGTRHSGDVSSRRFRAGLLSFQIALTLAILAVAALVGRELRSLLTVDPGFQFVDRTAFSVPPDEERYAQFFDLIPYYDRMLDALRAAPEIDRAELTTFPPLFGAALSFNFEIEHDTRASERAPEAIVQNVSSGYAEILGVPMLAGRGFDDRDTRESPLTVVINEALARRYFPDRNPIGERLRVFPWINPQWRTIVGVIADYDQDALDEAPRPQLYLPYRQTPWVFAHLVVTPSRPGQPVEGAVEAVLRRADPDLAVTAYTLRDLRDRQTARDRSLATLLGAFAVVAVALAFFGVYALVSLEVADQRREIGIRMALGADRSSILRHYLGRGMRTVALGLGVGTVVSMVSLRWLESLIATRAATPWMLLLVVALGLAACCALATTAPARRASRVLPNEALRQT